VKYLPLLWAGLWLADSNRSDDAVDCRRLSLFKAFCTV
jgi:hypothetical protein